MYFFFFSISQTINMLFFHFFCNFTYWKFCEIFYMTWVFSDFVFVLGIKYLCFKHRKFSGHVFPGVSLFLSLKFSLFIKKRVMWWRQMFQLFIYIYFYSNRFIASFACYFSTLSDTAFQLNCVFHRKRGIPVLIQLAF